MVEMEWHARDTFVLIFRSLRSDGPRIRQRHKSAFIHMDFSMRRCTVWRHLRSPRCALRRSIRVRDKLGCGQTDAPPCNYSRMHGINGDMLGMCWCNVLLCSWPGRNHGGVSWTPFVHRGHKDSDTIYLRDVINTLDSNYRYPLFPIHGTVVAPQNV